MTVGAVAAGRSTVAGGAVYVAVMTAIAAVAAWPIYRSWQFAVLVVVAATVAALIAVVARLRGWRGLVVTGVVAASVVVLGVPLAVPTRLGGLGELAAGLGEVAVGAVLGWKDLLTVELPVGAYRNLLVPALLVFLVGVCAALRLAWRPGRAAYAAAAVGLAMVSFGLFFGRTTVSAPLELGPLVLRAPVETATGVAAIVASIAWMAWRTREERMRALDRAAASTGIHLTRSSSRTDRRRAVLGGGMVAVAVLVAVAIVPAAAQGRGRDVLRTAVGPQIDLSQEVSPLATYRSLFADSRADDVVFTVSSGGPLPDRVRVATLDRYDGQVFRSGGSGTVDGAQFVRVPAARDAGPGAPTEVTVTIGALTGVWMPTAGSVASVRFSGARAGALADRFYYSGEALAGVQTADGGFAAGDTYTVSAVQPTAVALQDAVAPGTTPAVEAPPNLRAWVKQHVSGTGGAALASLVTLLRERGYLSHALSIDPANPPVWMRALGDYGFQPSASGHSLARVDALFGRLLQREGDARAATTGDYVAAIGDDEQFAVAVALMAQELGFPARVVLGARLTGTDPDLAVCDSGTCRAQDLSAWAEVRTASGDWVPVDATPQHTVAPSLDLTQLRDPQNVTEVRPDGVADVVPPPPLQEDTAQNDSAAPAGLDLSWLWPVLRFSAIGLLIALVLCGPLVLVIAAKAARRRTRRAVPHPAGRVAAGWEEYADAAVDAGRPAPTDLTRSELATGFATASAERLAAQADRAVFGDAEVSEHDAEEYWSLVDADRRALRREGGLWRRARTAVSLRSFLRFLVPAGRRGIQPIIERGRRRAARARPST
ncbi:transglutaminase domain-containing protein [Microbacterium sp. CJ88]|uniref:transglutaminase domain-containing protein n=1 Tax=Microbacterium sp. CJ88 TaxID=3445672 RepID=UPI003F6577CE